MCLCVGVWAGWLTVALGAWQLAVSTLLCASPLLARLVRRDAASAAAVCD